MLRAQRCMDSYGLHSPMDNFLLVFLIVIPLFEVK